MLELRHEQPGDRTAIRALVMAAFGTAEEADLVDRLRSDGAVALSLVALEAGEIVGHILFSPMEAPFPALGLAPLSVLPAWQRRGVGSALLREGLDRAKRAGWQAVFVLGEPAYYRRFGFDPALAEGFQSRYAGPYFMAIALQGALPVREGRVDYAPAFSLLS